MHANHMHILLKTERKRGTVSYSEIFFCYTLCPITMIPDIFCCNSMHHWVLIIFGRNVSQKVDN